jgi:putative flippase GtrA
MLIQRFLNHRASRYFVVGCIAASVQLMALMMFVELLGVPKIPASVGAFLIAVTLNYAMQRKFTFDSNVDHVKAAPRFIAIGTAAAFANTLIFSYLVTVMHYMIAQIVTLLVVFVINYELNKRITFKSI